MKKFKKLIPAFCMLLVSAIMLGSSTFAWFSMNNKVTASNMSVQAKSNSTFLQIAKKGETSYDDDVNFNNSNAEVYPCKFTDTKIDADDSGAEIAANSFYTANNKNSDKATDAVMNRKTVDLGNDKYMLTSEVVLKLSADSEDYTGSLKLTFTKNSGHDSVTALVVINGKYYVMNVTDKEVTIGGATATGDNVTITSTQTLSVAIYVYIDGTNDDVNSDYFNTTGNSLAGSVTIGFEIAIG